MKLKEMDSHDYKGLKTLAEVFKCSVIDSRDELAGLLNTFGDATLYDLWNSDALSGKPNLRKMIQCYLLLTPHNMIVEQGFSQMKTTESAYSNRMSPDLYDGCRLIRDFFDREAFEDFEPEEDLLNRFKQAETEYKKSSQSKASTAKLKEPRANEIRLETGIFKQKTPKQITSELKGIDLELYEAEAALEKLKSRKRKLQDEKQAVVDRLDENSSCIIDKWFTKK